MKKIKKTFKNLDENTQNNSNEMKKSSSKISVFV